MERKFYYKILINQLNHYLRNKMFFSYMIRLTLIFLILISIIKFPLSKPLSLLWFITGFSLINIWTFFDSRISRKIIIVQEEIASGMDDYARNRYIKNFKKLEQEHLYESPKIIYRLFGRREYFLWIFLFLFLFIFNYGSHGFIEKFIF